MKRKITHLSQEVGGRIKSLRLAKGWSQERLGVEAGLGAGKQSLIGNHERGFRMPDHGYLQDYARVLGTTTVALLSNLGTSEVNYTHSPLVSWDEIGKVKRKHTRKQQTVQWPSVVPISTHAETTIVPDDSMAPEFRAGQLILVDTTLTPHNGDYVIALIDGKGCIRLYNRGRLKTSKSDRGVSCIESIPIIAVILQSVKTYR